MKGIFFLNEHLFEYFFVFIFFKLTVLMWIPLSYKWIFLISKYLFIIVFSSLTITSHWCDDAVVAEQPQVRIYSYLSKTAALKLYFSVYPFMKAISTSHSKPWLSRRSSINQVHTSSWPQLSSPTIRWSEENFIHKCSLQTMNSSQPLIQNFFGF